MPINDHYVQRTARIYIEIHREQAVARARERVADLQKRGDPIGADMWLRIHRGIACAWRPAALITDRKQVAASSRWEGDRCLMSSNGY